MSDNNEEIPAEWKNLYQILQEQKEEEFLEIDNLQKHINEVHEEQTLLHRATIQGLPRAVEKLLKEGAISVSTKRYPIPVEVAAHYGYHKIFEVFLTDAATDVPHGILVELLKYIDEEIVHEDMNHNKCIELLFKYRNINVNYKEQVLQNTPLHYAAKYGRQDSILQLLRKHASLVSKNIYGDLPIEDIDFDTLKVHFDECIEPNFRPDSDRRVTYNFTTLMPPKTEIFEGLSMDTRFVLESEGIFYMSKSNKMKELLKHPFIMSLLYRKWSKVKYIFFYKTLIYSLFYLSLISYILLVYNAEPYHVNYLYYIPYGLLILFEILALLFQPRIYFKYISTWLKIVLGFSVIVIWGLIFIDPSHNNDFKKWLSVLGILFSACNFLFMLSQHPKLGVNIIIWYTVSWTYIQFLPCIIIPLFAFAFTFRVSMKLVGYGIFETVLSLTGDNDLFDFDDETTNLTKIIFVMFLFLMVMILMNTLNALAVSDAQRICKQAEAEGQAICVEQIFYLENLFLNQSTSFRRFAIRILRRTVPWLENWVFLFPSEKNFCLKAIAEPKRIRHWQWEYVYLSDEIINRTIDIIHARKVMKE